MVFPFFGWDAARRAAGGQGIPGTRARETTRSYSNQTSVASTTYRLTARTTAEIACVSIMR
jgi:hypothetical protein